MMSQVKGKKETRRGHTKTTTRRKKWFVRNATNRATRRKTVPYGNANMA